MKQILVKHVILGTDALMHPVDILISGNKIKSINSLINIDQNNDIEVIDGTGKAVFPSFCNMHTHSAMSLFRGYGDDMPLERWLQEKIWPNEANLTPEIVYWGSKLACLEMIKSGTTCFNDMYFHYDETARATEEMGMRAMLSLTFFDHFSEEIASKTKQDILNYGKHIDNLSNSDLIHWSIAPHSVYTVSGNTLKWASDFAREHKMKFHIHAAESPTECNNSLRDLGATPIRHLNNLGILNNRTILAHSVWLDDDEIHMVGDNGCAVVHNPNSNLKLASGHAFKYNELKYAGATITLGTDGCSSSNNLDMIEAMKVMSLLQKGWRLEPTALPAGEVLEVASKNGFKALGIDAGEIKEGKLADLILVDLNNLAFVPNNNTLSNLVYASHGDCVDTVICNGKVIMRDRKVPGEKEIIENARRIVKKLITH